VRKAIDVLLLAIDTSTRRIGVALGDGNGVHAAFELGGPCDTRPPRHAEEVAPAIDHLARRCGVALTHLSAIAVSIGPGMFTGLRVGVTTAKVLAQALRIPVIPIASLDLLAYPLRHANALVVPVMDARRHEVYYAMYQPVPGGIQRLGDYDLGPVDDVTAELAARGSEALVCGDGALRFRGAFADLERVDLAGPGNAAPSLAALIELAAGRYEREEFCAPADVVPLYLRRSDAEIAWDHRA
jgi:tRNA threonylcarbamoyladenosine biosynthesis protein TsaB